MSAAAPHNHTVDGFAPPVEKPGSPTPTLTETVAATQEHAFIPSEPRTEEPELRWPTGEPVLGALKPPPVVGLRSQRSRPLLPAQRIGSSLSAVVGEVAGLRLVGASSAGRSHVGEGAHDEDAFAWATREDGLLLALADGASSADYAAIASRRAARRAVAAAEDLDWVDARRLLQIATEAGRAALVADMPSQRSRDQVATTLTVATARATDNGLELWYRSIGNTYVFVVSSDGRLELDDEPGTTFLTWPADRMIVTERHLTLRSDEAVLLTTDGVGSDLLRSDTIREWFGVSLLAMRGPLQAASLVGYHLEGSGDDRTFVTIRTVDGK